MDLTCEEGGKHVANSFVSPTKEDEEVTVPGDFETDDDEESTRFAVAKNSSKERTKEATSDHRVGKRFCNELSPCPSQGWFSIVDGTTKRQIDVVASFGPTTTISWLAKLLGGSVTIGTLCYGWVTDSNPAHEYMYKLTRWGVFISSCYFLLSIVNTCLASCTTTGIPQSNKVDSSNLHIRLTWSLFTIAAHSELLITILYWALVYEPGNSKLDYNNFSNHGGICLLVWLNGLVIDRIPVRMRHWYSMALPFELAFVVWSVIHSMVISENGPLYDVLDWNEDWSTALMYSVLAILPLGFFLYCILWMLSLYNPLSCCCCALSKSDRLRYLNDDNADQKGRDLEEASIAWPITKIRN